jgi:hypothetical protein
MNDNDDGTAPKISKISTFSTFSTIISTKASVSQMPSSIHLQLPTLPLGEDRGNRLAEI